ncbi:MAG: hypothetical protein JRD89_16950 [Deltaproteobacteria bacterium]|nr:hypothetical protein [Deltaproteobacteria bacterium]
MTVTRERFKEVLRASEGNQYELALGVAQVSILHGLLSLAMDHPGLQELGGPTMTIARRIRDWCLSCFKEMGFSDEEVAQIDTMREEQEGNELRLGPRLVMVGGKLVGTCDDLSLTIAEATKEEIEELRGADAIRLVKPRG